MSKRISRLPRASSFLDTGVEKKEDRAGSVGGGSEWRWIQEKSCCCVINEASDQWDWNRTDESYVLGINSYEPASWVLPPSLSSASIPGSCLIKQTMAAKVRGYKVTFYMLLFSSRK